MQIAIVTRKSDLPETDHYAIITFSTRHVPGDERSRTNPGHGYPAHSVGESSYLAYGDKEAWKADIAEMERSGNPYVAAEVRPVKVKMQTSVTVRRD